MSNQAPFLSPPTGLSESYFDVYDYETDYYYDYNRGESNDPLPTFTARPQTFTVEVGQSVMIPCDVNDPGELDASETGGGFLNL